MLTKNWAAQPLFWPVRSVGGYLLSLRTFRKVGSYRTRSEVRRASHGSNINRITSWMPLTPPENVCICAKACCTWVLSEFPSPSCGSSVSPVFSCEARNPFLVLKMKDFRNFVLHDCILIFDAELQVTNLKNKEVTVNPKPQALVGKLVFRKPLTLIPKS